MGAVVLNKPQIKGETKLRAAVRGWNAWNDLFRFNAQLSTISSQPSTALYERRIKGETNATVTDSALPECIAENVVDSLTHW